MWQSRGVYVSSKWEWYSEVLARTSSGRGTFSHCSRQLPVIQSSFSRRTAPSLLSAHMFVVELTSPWTLGVILGPQAGAVKTLHSSSYSGWLQNTPMRWSESMRCNALVRTVGREAATCFSCTWAQRDSCGHLAPQGKRQSVWVEPIRTDGQREAGFESSTLPAARLSHYMRQ